MEGRHPGQEEQGDRRGGRGHAGCGEGAVREVHDAIVAGGGRAFNVRHARRGIEKTLQS